jgi:hypothetical protein
MARVFGCQIVNVTVVAFRRALNVPLFIRQFYFLYFTAILIKSMRAFLLGFAHNTKSRQHRVC